VAGRVTLLAVAADNRLWQRDLTGDTWGDWFRRPDFATDEIQGSPAAEPGSLVLRGVDGRLHRTTSG